MDPTQQPQEPQQPQQPQPQPQWPQQPQQPMQPIQPPVVQPMISQQPIVAKDPNSTLGIVGLVLAFLFSPAGIVISIIAFIKSKKAGFKNTMALVGIILGSVMLVLSVLAVILIFSASNNVINDFKKDCDSKGGTTIDSGGGIYKCEYKIYQ